MALPGAKTHGKQTTTEPPQDTVEPHPLVLSKEEYDRQFGYLAEQAAAARERTEEEIDPRKKLEHQKCVEDHQHMLERIIDLYHEKYGHTTLRANTTKPLRELAGLHMTLGPGSALVTTTCMRWQAAWRGNVELLA